MAVYALRPSLTPAPTLPAGRQLDRTGWRATANAAADLAPRAFDADPATGWRSWGDLDASVQRATWEPRSILERWNAHLQRAPATLTIDLGATARVVGIRLQLGGSDPMLLPELRVGVSTDADTWTTLHVRPFPDVRALVAEASRAPMAAVLAAPLATRYVRIEVGAYDSQVADVVVLAE